MTPFQPLERSRLMGQKIDMPKARFAIGDVLIPLATHDPVVTAIYAALVTRNLAREAARNAVHFIRKRKFR